MSAFTSSRSGGGRSGKGRPKRIEFRPLRSSDDEDTGEEVELLSRGSINSNTLKRRSPTVINAAGAYQNDYVPSFTSSNSAFTTAPIPSKFFIEHKLQPDDTVSSLSLRYSCSIADLKRLNGLTADQDLFALKVVKIPVSPFGALKQSASSPKMETGASSASNRTSNTSPTESTGPESDSTRPERFFSKIDSSMQESFFWLAKKPILPSVDEGGDGSPDVVISTGAGHSSHSPSFTHASFPKPSGGPAPVAGGAEESWCSNNKLTICIFISAFAFVFVLLPIAYYLHVLWKEQAHQQSLLVQQQNSSRHSPD